MHNTVVLYVNLHIMYVIHKNTYVPSLSEVDRCLLSPVFGDGAPKVYSNCSKSYGYICTVYNKHMYILKQYLRMYEAISYLRNCSL